MRNKLTETKINQLTESTFGKYQIARSSWGLPKPFVQPTLYENIYKSFAREKNENRLRGTLQKEKLRLSAYNWYANINANAKETNKIWKQQT